MSTFKKYALVAITIIIAIASIYGYREFNRKPANVSSLKTQVIITADSIITAYERDEVKANEDFLGKTILVNGVVSEMNNEHDTLLNVIIGNNGSGKTTTIDSIALCLSKGIIEADYNLSIQNSARWVFPVISISKLRINLSTNHGLSANPSGIC